MIFGVAVAAIAGFLQAAVPKWTSTAPLAGAPVGLLSGLWVLGRVGMWVPGFALLDLVFLPVLAVIIGRHTRIFPPEYAADTDEPIIINEFARGADIANYLLRFLPEGVYYDRNRYRTLSGALAVDSGKRFRDPGHGAQTWHAPASTVAPQRQPFGQTARSAACSPSRSPSRSGG